jgi:hypothetical protein
MFGMTKLESQVFTRGQNLLKYANRIGLVVSILSITGFVLFIILSIMQAGNSDTLDFLFFTAGALGAGGQILQFVIIVPRIFSPIHWHMRTILILLLIPLISFFALTYHLFIEIIRFLSVRTSEQAKEVMDATLDSGSDMASRFAQMPDPHAPSARASVGSAPRMILSGIVGLPIATSIAGVALITSVIAVQSPLSFNQQRIGNDTTPTATAIAGFLPTPTPMASATMTAVSTSLPTTVQPTVSVVPVHTPVTKSTPVPVSTPTPAPFSLPFSALIGTWQGPGQQQGDTACAQIIVSGGSSSNVTATYAQYRCDLGPGSTQAYPANGTYVNNHLSLVVPSFCSSNGSSASLEFDAKTNTTLYGIPTASCEGNPTLYFLLTRQ